MILSSEYMLTDKDGILGEIAKQANNLYNACLYQVRQAFIKHGKVNNYNYYDSLFKIKYRNRENMLYHKLGYVQSAQQTIKEVNTIWNAWLKALKAFKANPSKFSGKPRMPKYLPKAKKHSFFVTIELPVALATGSSIKGAFLERIFMKTNKGYQRGYYPQYAEQKHKEIHFVFMTWIIILICGIVYWYEVKLSNNCNVSISVMDSLGGVSRQLVTQGQMWRIFTSMWLHWTPEHILSNMTFLYLAGSQIEKVFGHIRFLLIYLISGIVGDLAACYLSSPTTISAGASTALFGVMLAGATLRWTIGAREYGNSMITLFVTNIVLDLAMPGISLVGHLGGAVAGIVMGFIIQPRNKDKWYTNLLFELLCLIIIIIALLMYFIYKNN